VEDDQLQKGDLFQIRLGQTPEEQSLQIDPYHQTSQGAANVRIVQRGNVWDVEAELIRTNLTANAMLPVDVVLVDVDRESFQEARSALRWAGASSASGWLWLQP
jgi:hypothetical protein